MTFVEYLEMRRRIEGQSGFEDRAQALATRLFQEEGTLPTVTQLWDRLIARAIGDESEGKIKST